MVYMRASLSERWVRVFATELAGAPAMTLRGGRCLWMSIGRRRCTTLAWIA